MEHIRRELTPETGAVLRRARKARGWTLAKASEEAGISLAYLSQIERAVRCPSVTVAGALAKGYQLSRDDTIALMSEAVRNAGRDKPSKRKATA